MLKEQQIVIIFIPEASCGNIVQFISLFSTPKIANAEK